MSRQKWACKDNCRGSGREIHSVLETSDILRLFQLKLSWTPFCTQCLSIHVVIYVFQQHCGYQYLLHLQGLPYASW